MRDTGSQRVGDRLKPRHVCAAPSATVEVLAVAIDLLLLECREDIGSSLAALLAVAVESAHLNTASVSSRPRIFSKPRRIRPLTVPIGRSSIVAISVWVKPPKYASSMT